MKKPVSRSAVLGEKRILQQSWIMLIGVYLRKHAPFANLRNALCDRDMDSGLLSLEANPAT